MAARVKCGQCKREVGGDDLAWCGWLDDRPVLGLCLRCYRGAGAARRRGGRVAAYVREFVQLVAGQDGERHHGFAPVVIEDAGGGGFGPARQGRRVA